MSEPGTRLILLRHGEVASHQGDVPVTPAGVEHAERSGKALGLRISGPLLVLYGGTRRTRETAEAVVRGIDDSRVSGPFDSFALRNPDLYAAGRRVNMVSSPAALAEQVPGMTSDDASSNDWWTTFFASSDRIGWWLRHDNPPGEGVADLTRRILHFANSLADPGPTTGQVVVGVTHSPLIRSLLLHATGNDPGEPAYVTGAEIRVPGGQQPRRLDITPYDPIAD
ncbi:MAG: phosphoglycerate mutase family protein [Tetrasphaera jenkinsii]|jgi:broad specificity phosphatase PhoE|nr:phosphoglycerate mutase family protein [Tetrasphaera jenkinsii]